jgi:predicted transcriptional regulator of viral defense system
MRRRKKKTGIEKEVYLSALRNRFITIGEAKEIAKKDSTARMALWRLSCKGNLRRVRSGLYAAIPLEISGKEFEVNRYLMFDRAMGSKGALAFHSALELHGVAQSDFNTVYYLSTLRKSSFATENLTFRPVWAPRLFGVTTVHVDEIPVRVTDKERTFLDCVRRPNLCGGLEEFLKSAEGFTTMSPVKLMDYLERFDEQSLYQRTGFILTFLGTRIRTSDDLLEALRKRVGKNVYYLTPGRKKRRSRLNKEWNVMVPVNLEEMVKFV